MPKCRDNRKARARRRVKCLTGKSILSPANLQTVRNRVLGNKVLKRELNELGIGTRAFLRTFKMLDVMLEERKGKAMSEQGEVSVKSEDEPVPFLAGFHLRQSVVLASGGPTMTVIGFSPNGRIWCQWEMKDRPIEEASFIPQVLRPVT